MTQSLPAEARRAALVALATDFDLYARSILRIRPKSGGAAIPFVLNAAQRHIHKAISEQERDTGKVRAIILKGRQQGASTYTEGRFFWRITHRHGVKGYILTHEQKATDNLFGMVERYYQESPAAYRPHLGASNAKELIFDLLDSRYEVATAGSRDTGRSGTAQYLHGSEVGFWQHAADHMAGIGQVVPDAPGTEIILESTANGTANIFHEFWTMASKGKSEYLPIFVPWYWQDEYRRAATNAELTADEEDYQAAFGGLSAEQMAWRRSKIDTDFRGDVSLFDQEYPASAELAFASSSPRALIKATLVAKARRARGLEPVGRKIMAVDPAEYGDDSTSVAWRQGRVSSRVGKWQGLGTMETVGRVGLLADKLKPDVIFVDATGVGTGVADRLKEEGYPVVRIHFGESPRDGDRYVLMRDELWGELAEWLADEPASIEDDDDMASQLTSVQYGYDSKRRLKMEPKEAMKKRGLHSPDDADALALTFARGSGQASGVSEFRKSMGYDD